MGNKFTKQKSTNRINQIFNEFLESKTNLVADDKFDNDQVDSVNNSYKNICIRHQITNESEARSFNIIDSALNIADKILAKSVIKNQKINLNWYSTFLYVENEKLFKNSKTNFLQDYEQFEFIEKFFNVDNFNLKNNETNENFEQNNLIFFKKIHISNKFSSDSRKKINNSVNSRNVIKIQNPGREVDFFNSNTPNGFSDVIKLNEITSNLSELKIIETEIQKRNEIDNTLESFVMPLAASNKSFDEMSLQEYLDMETQRLRLKNFKSNKKKSEDHKIELKVNSGNINKKSSEDVFLYNRISTEPNKNNQNFKLKNLNIIRNKNLENNKKIFDLSQTEKSKKIKITHVKNDIENIKIKRFSTFRRNIYDPKPKILIGNSENLERLKLNGVTTEIQSTNLTNNLQRSKTTTSGSQIKHSYLTNQKSDSKFNKNVDMKMENFYNYGSNKIKGNPIACIKIDIRDLLKEDINVNINDNISDKFFTFDNHLETQSINKNNIEYKNLFW